MRNTILVIGWLWDTSYLEVIKLIREWNTIIIADNLENGCLKYLRIISKEVGYPPKFYEVYSHWGVEIDTIITKHSINRVLNYI